MTETRCARCHSSLAADGETCPECGELTPLGVERERRLRRRAARPALFPRSFRDPNISLALLIASLVLMMLAIVAFATMVDAGLF